MHWCAEAIGSGGLVHLFGTGHSRIPVEEMFPRYGSYPGWNPIVELSMTFHTQVVGANGQRQAMFIERTPGLAAVILDNFTFGPADVMVVFSASGLTAVPVEMARGARARGMKVIAVTSVEQSMSAEPPTDPRRAPPRRGGPRHRPLHAARRRAVHGRRPRHAGRARLDHHRNCHRERHQGPGRGAPHRARRDASGHHPLVRCGGGAIPGAVRPGLSRACPAHRRRARPATRR